ncbi:putative reverse transcriptase zinc-binding domain-containing protein [Helianthus annuus]|uniref:Reverse transcriptase zinc-binding domain-containing protein n=1 Tax=Helianthus annuus TaxID=4232 RepID=A0A9K3HMH5_HELAN|nr:putative reverse transcriptase zinc-binding domain-containing protein [Helianthus annuus]
MKAKKFGGMGVGGIQDFNQAMLAKWWWRFKANPNHLWAKVVAAIHYGNNSPLLIPLKKSIPGVWKDVSSVETALAKIGINIKEFLVKEGDVWRWRSDPNGSFSLKQVRMDIESATDGPTSADRFVFGWNSWAPPKVNFLLWRACLGKIASKVGLIHRGIQIQDSFCSRCGISDEDPDHIFVNCLWARSIWWNILTWIRIHYPTDICNLKGLTSYISSCPGGKVWKRVVYSIVMATVWRIWSARNEKVFNDLFIPISKSVEMIKEDAFLWICNRANVKRPSWDNWKAFDLLDVM